MPQILLIFLFLLIANGAYALTLTTGQEQFTTSSDIFATSGDGISSNLDGTIGNLNSITNNHIITTGNNGSVSSARGIDVGGEFYQIINSDIGEINTTGSSGRGISASGGNSIINNLGNISTLGSSSYGIFIGGDNNIGNNLGTIISNQSRGISLDGNFNQFTNSGVITTNSGSTSYGIYVSAGVDLEATNDNFSAIINEGEINSSSHGILNNDNFSRIANSGTITSGSSTTSYGIENSDAQGAVITNSGTINSSRYAIYNNADDVIINNSGILNGGIRLGNATFNILGGSINGEIQGNNEGRIVIGSNLVNINYLQTNDFENLASLTIETNSSLTSAKLIEAQNIFIKNSGNLNISSGFASNAIIRGINNNEGTINFSNISYAGNLGANGFALANINIDSNSSFNSLGNIFAQNINNFGALNLSQNNSIISGNVTINNAASINLQNATHQIFGNFNLNSGATLNSLLDNNNLGKLEIAGDITISNQAKININFGNNNYIANSTRFEIIDAQNEIAQKILDENISINNQQSNISGLLKFTNIIDGGNSFIQANYLQANEVSQNQNIQNIYHAINSIGNRGNSSLRDFQNFLNSSNLTIKEAEKAINQILPFPTKAQILTTQNILRNNLKINEKRLEELHISASKNYGFWTLAFANNLQQKQVASDEEFSANSVGIMLGFDKEINEIFDAGFAISYNKSDVKVLDNSKSNFINSAQISGFASYNLNGFYLDFIGALALHDFNQKKNINAINASSNANYFGRSYLAKINLSKINSLPWQLKFIPKASLSFSRSEIDNYQENGAGSLDLRVAKTAANYLEGKFGFDFGKIGKINHVSNINQLSAFFKAAYLYNIFNDKPSSNVSFVNYNQNFTQKISQIDESGLQIGFELGAIHDEDVTFSLEYIYEKRKTLESNFLLFKARQAF